MQKDKVAATQKQDKFTALYYITNKQNGGDKHYARDRKYSSSKNRSVYRELE